MKEPKTYILLIILLLCIHFQAYPQAVNPTGSIRFRNAPVTEVLDSLERMYKLRFFYREEWLAGQWISGEFSPEDTIRFLTSVFENRDLGFVFYDRFSVVIAPSASLSEEFTERYYMLKRRQEKFLSENVFSEYDTLVVLGDSTSGKMIREVILKGKVIDQLNNSGIPGVNIVIESTGQVLTTAEDGFFRMNIPSGTHAITVSHVGYDPARILLNVWKDDEWKIPLIKESLQLDEITISGSPEIGSVQSVSAGITKLSSKKIKELPVFLGEADVIRSILTLPGVSTTGEGTGGFQVRGGNIDQNLILQDHAIIYNSAHALGFFSVFNPDVVSEVTLYKGHIPAQYGGRASSVLDVKLKGLNSDQLNLTGGIGFVTSKLTANIPVLRGSSSLLLGGRISYSDWILQSIDAPSIRNSSASFSDVNVKFIQKTGEKGILSAGYYQSSDYVRFEDDYGFEWKNQNGGVTWNYQVKKNIDNQLNIQWSSITNHYFNPTGVDAFRLTNQLGSLQFKDELTIQNFSRHLLTAGLEGIHYETYPDRMDPYNGSSKVLEQSVDRDNGRELSSFLNDEFIINHLWSVAAGLRFSVFQSLGPFTKYFYQPGRTKSDETIIDSLFISENQVSETYLKLEPRVSLKYSPNPVSSFKISYNRLNQYVHLVSNTVSPVPSDLWQVSNEYFAPQVADNFSAGYFRTIGLNQWETSIDGYYRETRNIPIYKDFSDISLNTNLETELIQGNGRSFGIEFFIRKIYGKLNGWLSYTWSRALWKTKGTLPGEILNQGEWFPAHYDKPHQLNVVMDLRIKRGSFLSMNFTYQSGRPVTAPNTSYYQDYYILPHYSGRNEYRIPDYHRLDLSYTIKRNVVRNKRYRDGLTFSIYNIYSRENAFSVFFRRMNNSNADAFKLSVLGRAFPSVTYNFEF